MSDATFPAEYRLYVPTFIRLTILAPAVFLVLVSIFLFAAAWWDLGENTRWFAGFAPLVLLVLFFSQHALTPNRIRWQTNGVVDFVSWLRTRSIPIEDFVSVKPDNGQFGALRIKHRRGSLHLSPHFDGFHEFVARVKAANPNVELRGC
jgi:hypothetical protein